ncbi:hypothetical protein LMH87_003614 [Akanthomyces muscarius]|uniref:Uncharacterized protein n=1 Tax=Akanthomyces muscarius TaxID=2231603 RepID=A0A9W8Q1R6_AKAMU|nr:hypothetical protein LMH87_003614 [Akanthomyces muscarius]KAJ4144743.1 hypothetical protein LMH87_003614 [Akanthomyces muscarius]
MLAQIHRNKRSAALASVLFVALLVYTWHSLNLESLLPAPLLHGGTHKQVPFVAARMHEVTCPGPIGEQLPSKRIPVVRGRNVSSTTHGETLSVPKVVVLIFYGRRSTVSILDCYLKRNLVSNGGLIDEVIWLRRTEAKLDLDFLQKLLDSETRYSKRDVDRTDANGFASAYEGMDDDTLYLKIDDDVVFIDDNALLSLICTKLTHPEYYIVSANVVNQPMISWLHWNLGAVLPYLPDTKNPYPELKDGEQVDWRASSLPDYDGPEDLNILEWSSPDKKKHRWLPMRNRTDHVLTGTPIVNTQYDAFGKGLGHWQIAAQQHYSFFENLENKELHKYKFNVWDFQLKRLGIQFMAVMGRDINGAKPIGQDDEQHFSVTMPEKTGRGAVADGRAIVAHYSFGPQSEHLPTTDILERYRSYAAENVCLKPMLWSPEDEVTKQLLS